MLHSYNSSCKTTLTAEIEVTIMSLPANSQLPVYILDLTFSASLTFAVLHQGALPIQLRIMYHRKPVAQALHWHPQVIHYEPSHQRAHCGIRLYSCQNPRIRQHSITKPQFTSQNTLPNSSPQGTLTGRFSIHSANPEPD